MDKQKKTLLPPYVMLMLVSVVMSLAIAGVYSLTKDTIETAALQARAEARSAVMPGAASMEELSLEDGAPVDYCYEAFDDSGASLGYVSQITAVGFGGEIEITVGVDTDGAVTGVSVGGKDFSETSGLGARTREPWFTEQFVGKSGLLVLKKDIDSVTGASISSGAVVSGVNKAVSFMTGLLPEDPDAAVTEELLLSEERIAALGVSDPVWMGGGAGIDGWWRVPDGYVVRATGFGEGPIAVFMAFEDGGTVTGMSIGDEYFMETEGRGAEILADWYQAQFIGKSGPQAYGAGIDAISGATVTSDGALAAINACMTFDPAEPDAEPVLPSAEPDPNPPVPTPDASTEATEPAATPEPTPDASTEATEPAATPEPTPDASTEASIKE